MSNELVNGSISYSSTYEPWPTTRPWPQNSFIYWPQPVATDEYANEVEVQRGDHDATLRFYRKRGTARSLVKEIVVPLGVLEWFEKGAK